jgi:hypothetical protein
VASTFPSGFSSTAAGAFPAGLTAGGFETLTTYDEGSWTPVLAFSGGNGTGTLTTAVGSYVRIGKWAWIRFRGLVTKGTAAGNLVITGIPAALAPERTARMPVYTVSGSYTLVTAIIYVEVPNATTGLNFRVETITTGGNAGLSAGDLGATYEPTLEWSYEID